MNGIVGVIGNAGRRDLFYLDKDFQMKQRYWNGSEWVIDWIDLGGIFTSVPAVVASMGKKPTFGRVDVGDVVHDLSQLSEHGGRHPVGDFSHDLTAAGAGDEGVTGAAPVRAERHGFSVAGGFTTADDVTTAEPFTPAAEPFTPTAEPVDVSDDGEQQRIDVFGLGLDYALYHKSLWGAAVDRPGPWSSLGGVFTSAPAAIWLDGQLHVFGLGADLAMYWRTWNGTAWSDGWARIGGYFSSPPAVVSWGPGRFDLFARHADFSLRHRQFENGAWAGDWQNLGGSLASAPAVVTWGPDRLDVFAVGNLDGVRPDAGLVHRWWDGHLWNDWEQIAGRATGDEVEFSSAPAVASWGSGRLDVFAIDSVGTLQHVWFADSSWSNPEEVSAYQKMRSTPMVLATAHGRLEIVAPGTDHNMWRKTLSSAGWEPLNWWQLGDHLRLPSQYRISIDLIRCNTPRSLDNDTVTGQCTLKVGNWPNAITGADEWPLRTRTQRQGDLGNSAIDEGQTNLMNFDPVTIELHEVAAFNYLFVNTNEPDDVLMAALQSEALELADWSVKTGIKRGSVGLGIDAVSVGELAAPITGSILTFLTGWLIDQLHAIVEDSCDGGLALENFVRRGDDLHRMVVGGQTVEMAVTHQGADSAFTCGAKSEYVVRWSIRRSTE